MRYAEPDIYLSATLVNGLPTCTFAPKPYNRKITNIVVTNTVASAVSGYRGQLRSVAIFQNLLGANNTLRGTINLPAGQTLFIQWSAAGSPVSGATARVSFERDDNPLEGFDNGHAWEVDLVSTLRVPNVGDSYILIGEGIPQQISTFILASGTFTSAAAIIFQSGTGEYGFIVVRDGLFSSSTVIMIRGVVDGATTLIYGFESASPSGALRIGNNGLILSDGNGNAVVSPPIEISGIGGTLIQLGLDEIDISVDGTNSLITLNLTGIHLAQVNAGVLSLDDSTGNIFVQSVNNVVASGSELLWNTESLTVAQSWNPVWTQLTTNPTLGNGSIIGRYRKQGNVCYILIKLVIGSTTVFGTGNMEFTLPFAPTIDEQFLPVYFRDDSAAGNRRPGCAQLSSSSDNINILISSEGVTSSTNPFMFATGDSIVIQGEYIC